MKMITSDFQKFLSDGIGIKVVRANQSKKRPKRPYVSWNIISQIKQGQKESGYTGSGLTFEEETAIPYLYNVEINFYTTSDREKNNGKLARELANDFMLYLSSSKGIEEAVQYDFKILNNNDYENLDTYLGSEWERRAIIELQVFSRESIMTQQDSIDSATVADTITININ
jgi:hypothetical protein